MKLSEKTHEKFIRFFEKMSKFHEGQEFELAYSEIQRETGTASTTLKRALQTLEAEGWLEIKPGRNTRYGRFQVVLVQKSIENVQDAELPVMSEVTPPESLPNPQEEIRDLYYQVENLRRRIRTQEMTIALLQERLAEVEDKLYKR
ncbi:IclR family transcriptional regulator [Desulfitobacterium metallireducens DSM 15288]|uniref:IclR family transcriptional regulator n=1 Tax=Desulfitobacterium metallireducens DSM 15288 TaxID=871968 RepID=W0EC41_9FIRM|nr:helix-turn-helix domain-containing protein [Desulfitobacterium metallireducens]AHF06759.1 IclR family transcriptional regulator [Desulfitobacterium metallireducens DSM 15288]